MRTQTHRAHRGLAALAKLATVVAHLGPDELLVLASIVRRLCVGEARYGRLNLVTDRRKFTGKEAREEAEDFLVYAACGWLTACARDASRRAA